MHNENSFLISQLNNCAIECNHCYNECLNESDVNMMLRCIELDRDCADICQLTASMLSRGSELSRQMLEVCAEVCKECADECAKHSHEHCKMCEETCRKCAEACSSVDAQRYRQVL